jgi:ankyrin repeat protein
MNETHLEGAIYAGDWNEIENYITTGGDVNIQNYDGDSLLHFAVEKQKYEIIELLLDHGADINIQNDYGETPLHTAVELFIEDEGHYTEADLIEFLVNHGADIHIKNEDRKSPLQMIQNYEWDRDRYEISSWMESKYRQLNPFPAAAPVAINVPSRNIPSDSSNTISYDNIKEGNAMVNFHDEFKQGRYYKKNTYDKLKEKINPYTRVPINETTEYKAHIVGGKRKTRKMKKAKKTKAKKGNKRTRKH